MSGVLEFIPNALRRSILLNMATHAHDGLAPHSHSHDGGVAHAHSHDGLAPHTHETLYGPGSYTQREMPIVEGRDWHDRAFTIGIGGYDLLFFESSIEDDHRQISVSYELKSWKLLCSWLRLRVSIECQVASFDRNEIYKECDAERLSNSIGPIYHLSG